MRRKAITQFRNVTKAYNVILANTADMGGQAQVVYKGAKHPDISNIKNPLPPLFKSYTTFNIDHKPDVHQDLTKPLENKYHNRYDLVISFDTIEHVKQPFLFCKSMEQAAKPNGLIYLSTVFAWPYHGRKDYFRFTADGLQSCFEELPVECLASGWDGDGSYLKKQTGVFFFGRKHE